MLTPREIEEFPKQLENQFTELEMRIMQDVVNRIKVNGEITSITDWKLTRLKELGQSEYFIRKTLAILLNKTGSEIGKIFKKTAQMEYIRDKSLYERIDKEFIPYKDNTGLQQFVNSIEKQTNKEFTNITRSLGFATKTNKKVTSVDLFDYYQKTLDKAMLDITSGAFSKEEVIKRTANEMTNSGLRTIDYESGYSNRVNVAVRRAVTTGIGQLAGKVNEENAKKLDTEYFEISWHATARPEHQLWQGRVYKKDELVSVCELGSAGGLCGCNCRHSYRPFIPGVSVRVYTDKQLEEMNKKENEKISYNGREYTLYDATQHMRQFETRMRAQRQKIKLLESAEGSKDDILSEKAKYWETMRRYKDFAEKMDLPQQRQRIYDDGLGRV